jgi:ribose transport system permease protein
MISSNTTNTSDTIPVATGRQSLIQRWAFSNEFGLVLLIALAVVIFASTLPGFTSPFSLFTIGRQIGIDTMIGLAMMAIIVSGGLDLSVGAIGVCSAMAFGWLIERAGVPLYLGVPLAVMFGAGLGFINGAVVVRSGVHSFIITLASMSIFFGIMIFLSQAQAFRAMPLRFWASARCALAVCFRHSWYFRLWCARSCRHFIVLQVLAVRCWPQGPTRALLKSPACGPGAYSLPVTC